MKTSKTLSAKAEYLTALASICDMLEDRRNWYMNHDEDGNEQPPTEEDGYSYTAYTAYTDVLKAVEKLAKIS